MKPSEIFNEGEEFERAKEFYWTTEMVLASEVDSVGFTWLADFRDPEQRKCGICSKVNDTNEFGSMNQYCSDKKCAALKKYWQIFGDLSHFSNFNIQNKDVKNRGNYLKARMKKFLNVTKLSQIPIELRYEFLLTAMIERMAHEQNTGKTPDQPND